MKNNVLTVLSASVMVMIAVGALFIAMTMYEKDNFEESWTLTPAVIEIEDELKPLYSEEFNVNSPEY